MNTTLWQLRDELIRAPPLKALLKFCPENSGTKVMHAVKDHLNQ